MTMTIDSLRAEIEQHQQTIADTEREIGAAALDGKSTTAPTRRAQEARAEIERCEAAIGELERREADEAEERRRGAMSEARREAYLWIAEYWRRYVVVCEAHRALIAAEDHMLAFMHAPGAAKARRDATPTRYRDATISDLDADVLEGLSDLPSTPNPRDRATVLSLRAVHGAEGRKDIIDLAERRAAAEAAGEGVDFSGMPSTYAVERDKVRADRRARRAAERGQAA